MILSNNKSNDASNSISAYSHNQPDNGTFELYHNGRNFSPIQEYVPITVLVATTHYVIGFAVLTSIIHYH